VGGPASANLVPPAAAAAAAAAFSLSGESWSIAPPSSPSPSLGFFATCVAGVAIFRKTEK